MAADCFGTMLPYPVTDAAQPDPLFWEYSLLFETRAHIEWHTMLGPGDVRRPRRGHRRA